MRAGLPVAATDVGGVREAVTHGITGFLSPKGDVESMRMHLARLIADPVLRRETGARGRRSYLENFTLDRMLSRTRAVYADVLSAGRISDAERDAKKSVARVAGMR